MALDRIEPVLIVIPPGINRDRREERVTCSRLSLFNESSQTFAILRPLLRRVVIPHECMIERAEVRFGPTACALLRSRASVAKPNSGDDDQAPRQDLVG